MNASPVPPSTSPTAKPNASLTNNASPSSGTDTWTEEAYCLPLVARWCESRAPWNEPSYDILRQLQDGEAMLPFPDEELAAESLRVEESLEREDLNGLTLAGNLDRQSTTT